jgi:hypothetical protein
VNKRAYYRTVLRETADWDDFLMAESGLPGPRANLELAQAAADEGDEVLFRRYVALGPDAAPTNSPLEFLAFCGVVGLGRLLAGGRRDLLPVLRVQAADPRWRQREAVAMALQRWGQVDMDALLKEMRAWSQGSLLERRAAVAALCEPALLAQAAHAEEVLQVLDEITASLLAAADRRGEPFRILRQALGYGWSVAVAAAPEAGTRMMAGFFASADEDIRWVMKQNLAKKRLERLDPEWLARGRIMLG